jgi:hypothetical protein
LDLTGCRRSGNVRKEVPQGMTRSPYDRLPAVVSDAVALDLDGRGSNVHGLGHDRYEPREHEPGRHFVVETGETKECLRGAVFKAVKQF